MPNHPTGAAIVHIEKLLKAQMNERWQQVTISPLTRPQDAGVIRIEMFGITKDNPPRFFRWRTDIPESSESANALNVIRDTARMLDSFLHPECACVPAPDGGLREHCTYHKKLLGEA